MFTTDQQTYLNEIKKLTPFERLCHWIREREQVRSRKEAGQPAPWTEDPILQNYRFCNVHREDDKVTRWITDNWRTPNAGNVDQWFAMTVSRFVNWPDTLGDIGYPVPWRPDTVLKRLNQRKNDKQQVWNSAYIVSTNGMSIAKPEYVVKYVLNKLWFKRNILRPKPLDTLNEYSSRLIKENGFKGFMVGQVIADLKYDPDGILSTASDWETWALSGPGSRRGLNRVLSRHKRDRWKEADWFEQLTKLRIDVLDTVGNSVLESNELGYNTLHAQDLQNCLCEFDKYERTLWGEGKPRNKYRGY